MTRNTLADLNDHLFAELERLGDEGLDGDALKDEMNRARAVCAVAEAVISNASAAMRAVRMREELGAGAKVPRMLAPGD